MTNEIYPMKVLDGDLVGAFGTAKSVLEPQSGYPVEIHKTSSHLAMFYLGLHVTGLRGG
jgi:hypothetical protein